MDDLSIIALCARRSARIGVLNFKARTGQFDDLLEGQVNCVIRGFLKNLANLYYSACMLLFMLHYKIHQRYT